MSGEGQKRYCGVCVIAVCCAVRNGRASPVSEGGWQAAALGLRQDIPGRLHGPVSGVPKSLSLL